MQANPRRVDGARKAGEQPFQACPGCGRKVRQGPEKAIDQPLEEKGWAGRVRVDSETLAGTESTDSKRRNESPTLGDEQFGACESGDRRRSSIRTGIRPRAEAGKEHRMSRCLVSSDSLSDKWNSRPGTRRRRCRWLPVRL
eukprot:3505460-Rhodomonas_salina.1